MVVGELEFVEKLAREAGKKIMEVYESGDVTIERKDDDSPLTKADLAANKIIMDGLREKFPSHGFLTEEEKDDKERLDKEYVWIIDPLDGTKEFTNRQGEFTVNIALVKNNRPILAFLYAPAKDELYFAVKGQGTYLKKGSEATKIKPSETQDIRQARAVRSRFHVRGKLKKFFNENKVKDTLAVGSSLKGCMVARGEADFYLRFGPQNEWDFCAMDLIVNESGGKMTDLEGKLIKYNKDNPLHEGFLVSNNKIHDEIIALVGEHG